MSTRYESDIYTELSFLTTRVKQPYGDEWGELKRAIKYLKGDKYIKHTFRLYSLEVIRWWVDA